MTMHNSKTVLEQSQVGKFTIFIDYLQSFSERRSIERRSERALKWSELEQYERRSKMPKMSESASAP